MIMNLQANYLTKSQFKMTIQLLADHKGIYYPDLIDSLETV